MNTFIKETKTEETQKVLDFHGEGAYHGSAAFREVPIPQFEEEESRPTTLISGVDPFQTFEANYPNEWAIADELGEFSQEEIRTDGTTFVWAPFEVALKEAGHITWDVLHRIERLLGGDKKHVYVDSKIQFFKKGDVPVDSKFWHVDGSISCRDSRATKHGHAILHDMKARQDCKVSPPRYWAFQSSSHCATQWVQNSSKLILPACIPSFEVFDKLVTESKPEIWSQLPGSIVEFDGFDIHRAVPASADGWRLWIRVTETDREISVGPSVIGCYGTVYRLGDT